MYNSFEKFNAELRKGDSKMIRFSCEFTHSCQNFELQLIEQRHLHNLSPAPNPTSKSLNATK